MIPQHTFEHRQSPPELFAHHDLENEWWYDHGHLLSGSRQFGFHLAFFRSRTDQIRVGTVFPLMHWADQIRFASLVGSIWIGVSIGARVQKTV